MANITLRQELTNVNHQFEASCFRLGELETHPGDNLFSSRRGRHPEWRGPLTARTGSSTVLAEPWRTYADGEIVSAARGFGSLRLETAGLSSISLVEVPDLQLFG